MKALIAPRRLWLLTFASPLLAVFIYSLFYLFWDKAIAQCLAHLPPAFISSAAMISLLGSKKLWIVIGAISLGVGLYHQRKQADSDRALPWLWLAFALLLAMIMTLLLKVVLGRARPELFFEQGLYGFYFFKTQWIYFSSPSGHTARIFAAMTVLSGVFPRARVLWLLIALSVAASRVLLNEHYVGDVILGAWVGGFSALWVNAFIAKPLTSQ